MQSSNETQYHYLNLKGENVYETQNYSGIAVRSITADYRLIPRQ